MTDLYAEAMAPIPQLDLRERLDHALATIADTELATVIATAGLAAVHEEWQRCRVDLAMQEDVARAMALRIAHLTDEARRWKRRWAGAVAQAKHEHERAEQLRAELADCQLAASEREGHAQRLPKVGDHVQISFEGRLVPSESEFGGYTLVYRPGPGRTEVGYLAIPPSATVTILGAEPQAAPCWCGHDPAAHVTDDADNAACNACIATPTGLHRAFHTLPHTPEQL